MLYCGCLLGFCWRIGFSCVARIMLVFNLLTCCFLVLVGFVVWDCVGDLHAVVVSSD